MTAKEVVASDGSVASGGDIHGNVTIIRAEPNSTVYYQNGGNSSAQKIQQGHGDIDAEAVIEKLMLRFSGACYAAGNEFVIIPNDLVNNFNSFAETESVKRTLIDSVTHLNTLLSKPHGISSVKKLQECLTSIDWSKPYIELLVELEKLNTIVDIHKTFSRIAREHNKDDASLTNLANQIAKETKGILTTIEQRNHKNIYLISGQYGSGKSAVVLELIRLNDCVPIIVEIKAGESLESAVARCSEVKNARSFADVLRQLSNVISERTQPSTTNLLIVIEDIHRYPNKQHILESILMLENYCLDFDNVRWLITADEKYLDFAFRNNAIKKCSYLYPPNIAHSPELIRHCAVSGWVNLDLINSEAKVGLTILRNLIKSERYSTDIAIQRMSNNSKRFFSVPLHSKIIATIYGAGNSPIPTDGNYAKFPITLCSYIIGKNEGVITHPSSFHKYIYNIVNWCIESKQIIFRYKGNQTGLEDNILSMLESARLASNNEFANKTLFKLAVPEFWGYFFATQTYQEMQTLNNAWVEAKLDLYKKIDKDFKESIFQYMLLINASSPHVSKNEFLRQLDASYRNSKCPKSVILQVALKLNTKLQTYIFKLLSNDIHKKFLKATYCTLKFLHESDQNAYQVDQKLDLLCQCYKSSCDESINDYFVHIAINLLSSCSHYIQLRNCAAHLSVVNNRSDAECIASHFFQIISYVANETKGEFETYIKFLKDTVVIFKGYKPIRDKDHKWERRQFQECIIRDIIRRLLDIAPLETFNSLISHDLYSSTPKNSVCFEICKEFNIAIGGKYRGGTYFPSFVYLNLISTLANSSNDENFQNAFYMIQHTLVVNDYFTKKLDKKVLPLLIKILPGLDEDFIRDHSRFIKFQTSTWY